MGGDDPLLNQAQVSKLLCGEVSTSTLEKWRCTGDGPDFIRVGRAVLYRRSAIERWLEARTVSHTTAAPTRRAGNTRRR
jgi:predicted DNA-binding transcriptional regulator AlpA